MIKSSLESKEGRDVAIIDTPGEYLHSYVGKHGEHRIIVLFKGEFVELMVMVYPNLYQKYVTYDIKGDFMLSHHWGSISSTIQPDRWPKEFW